jgi:hypothetical protein
MNAISQQIDYYKTNARGMNQPVRDLFIAANFLFKARKR